MDFENDLTSAQYEAASHVDGPLLVIAGAGSGKTRVITYRIAYLLEHGIPAGNILAITFTNKAAAEMRDRVYALFGERKLAGMWVTTFHSMCARILRREAEYAGFSRDYTIYDAQDSERLVKNVTKELDLDPATWRPSSVLSYISKAKNNLLTPENYKAPAISFFAKGVEKIYTAYQDALRAANAMDFDDLLMNTALLLRENPEVLKRYRDRFRYVLIDEYQDTNHAQYVIVRLIGKEHGNVCATGDPDQSIYGWRGADIGNILRFEKDFPGAKVVKLEENFRSTKRILACADKVIKHNIQRKERGLFSNGSEGSLIKEVILGDESEEADYMAAEASRLIESGRRPREIACLYRIGAISRNIENALLARSLPYIIVGSVAFYQRREIKDLLAYMRVIVNPADNVSLRRVINVPPRKIGTASVEKLAAAAKTHGVSLFDAARNETALESLGGPAQKKIFAFASMMEEIAAAGLSPVKDVLERILDAAGYREYLVKSEGEERAAERWENVEELVNATAKFDNDNPDGELGGFLEEAALVADIDRWDDREDRITLMTLHAAKGLEFPVVFLAAMEEGVFPHSRSLEEDGIEEERRICYVGVTRAREELYLTHTASRMRQGQSTVNIPSRFLAEMPADVLDVISLADESAPPRFRGRMRRDTDALPSIDYDTGERSVSGLSVGDVVKHGMFGRGKILGFSGDGSKAKVRVQFQRFGEKKLMLKYAGLMKI